MEFFSLLDFESIIRLMGPALESRIGGDVVVLGFVWFLMKKKIATHFHIIETNLGNISENILDLKGSIVSNELKQTRKTNDLEERVTRLETNNKGEY